mmetsp:Transcript_47240/g.122079  ORF Transcript_47240/g.122079 Transcript_47240/m.122079 type:complete len:721 (-) Transcript_47240:584-2746(-)
MGNGVSQKQIRVHSFKTPSPIEELRQGETADEPARELPRNLSFKSNPAPAVVVSQEFPQVAMKNGVNTGRGPHNRRSQLVPQKVQEEGALPFIGEVTSITSPHLANKSPTPRHNMSYPRKSLQVAPSRGPLSHVHNKDSFSFGDLIEHPSDSFLPPLHSDDVDEKWKGEGKLEMPAAPPLMVGSGATDGVKNTSHESCALGMTDLLEDAFSTPSQDPSPLEGGAMGGALHVDVHTPVRVRSNSVATSRRSLTRDASDVFSREMSSDARQLFQAPPTCLIYRSRVFYDEYRKVSSIGSGTFGEVRLVEHKATGTTFAAKVFYKAGHPLFRDGDFTQDEIEKECFVQAPLHFSCILQLEAVYDEPDRCTFVLDLAEGGEVKDYISKRLDRAYDLLTRQQRERNPSFQKNLNPKAHSERSRLPRPALGSPPPMSVEEELEEYKIVGEEAFMAEREVANVMVDLLAAIAYLHSHRVAHRDVKLDNLLRKTTEPDSDVVLCDYGFASELPPGKRFTAYCGSLLYMAPEVLAMKNGHRAIADDLGYLACLRDVCATAAFGNDGAKTRAEIDASCERRLPSHSSKSSSPFLRGRSVNAVDFTPINPPPSFNRRGGLSYGLECDLWSAGVCMYTMLTTVQPFFHHSKLDTIKSIFSGRFDRTCTGWLNMNVEAQTLICQLLHIHPPSRPPAIALLQFDPWIRKHAEGRANLRISELMSCAQLREVDEQ